VLNLFLPVVLLVGFVMTVAAVTFIRIWVNLRPQLNEQLVVVAPGSSGSFVVEVCDELTFGRAAGCEVTVDDRYVSPLHARVFRSSRGLVIEDLGSTNGTYVNRIRVEAPTPFSFGDSVQLGDTVVELW